MISQPINIGFRHPRVAASKSLPGTHAYQAFLDGLDKKANAGSRAMTGDRLRRIAAARRSGTPNGQIAKLINVSDSTVSGWWNKLPEGLR